MAHASPESLTDQIFIKAQRIRTLRKGEQKVEEGIQPEFVGIVNYCMMALVQLELFEDTPLELDPARPPDCTTAPCHRRGPR